MFAQHYPMLIQWHTIVFFSSHTHASQDFTAVESCSALAGSCPSAHQLARAPSPRFAMDAGTFLQGYLRLKVLTVGYI